MRKLFSLTAAIAVIVSLTLSMSHVSAASHAAAGSTAPKRQKGVTLGVWDWFCSTGQTTCPDRDAEVSVIKKWEKISGDKVAFPTNPSDHVSKMCTAAPAGQAPDVVGGPHDQVAVDVACQVVSPIPAWAWTPAQKKGYIKAAVQASTLSGHTYAVPYAIETTGLFYNKALISASAFRPAKGQKYLTWAKLIPELKKATPSGGIPLGWDQTNFYYDYAFISGAGGYVFKFTKKGYDYNQVGLATAGAIKGLTFIKDLTNHGKYDLYPDSMTYDAAKPLFEAGKVPVFYTGPWDRPDFDKNNIKYGFQPLPSFDGKHPLRPFSGLQEYYINKYSAHKNEAASLIAYLSAHLPQALFKSSGRIPVVSKVINSKAVQKDPILGGLAHAAVAAAPMPNIPEMGDVWTPAKSAITLVVKGQASPSDAAKAMVQQIKQAIAKAHGG
ncbi:MAG TPA: extracellular solute-binding protein [Chloroflexota bacterium]